MSISSAAWRAAAAAARHQGLVSLRSDATISFSPLIFPKARPANDISEPMTAL